MATSGYDRRKRLFPRIRSRARGPSLGYMSWASACAGEAPIALRSDPPSARRRAYYHLAAAAGDQTINILQQREYFKH